MINKLLVVGASTIIEQLFKIGLMDSSIEVTTTSSHEDVEALISKKSPDVIFIDPALKNANAFDLAKSLKDEHKTPIVILKGSASDWNDEEFSNSRADDILKKPFEPDALLELLKRLEGGKKMLVKNVAPKRKEVKKAKPEVKLEKTSIKPKQVKAERKPSLGSKEPKSALSLLKKAELENAKKFISTNLVRKGKSTVAKHSESVLRDELNNQGISISDSDLKARVDEVVKEVVERIVWEVVPKLADQIIREELERLTKE